jgi:hypothetical protein
VIQEPDEGEAGHPGYDEQHPLPWDRRTGDPREAKRDEELVRGSASPQTRDPVQRVA